MDTHKVIWTEGIFLGQQHFQQWDRYWESQQQIRFNMLAPLMWGLHSLMIDEEALLNARFSIRKCSIFFPHGQWINHDAHADGSLSCALQGDPGAVISIYACLPSNQQINGVTGYQNSSQITTWKADYQKIADEFDHNRLKEVLLGKPQLQLLRHDQAHDQFHAIKIAEVMSTGHGRYQLIANFIPAVTKIQTSLYLQTLITELTELVIAKIRILNEHCQLLKSNARNLDFEGTKNLLLAKSLSQSFVLLRHLQRSEAHPQQLYSILMQLCAELISYGATMALTELPHYQHDNLSQTFIELNKITNALLEQAMPNANPTIKLQRESESLYKVSQIDDALLDKQRFYVEVFFQADDAQWITQLSRQIKVAAASVIEDVVTSALPGVRVTHVQRPPQQLATKAGYEYFYLEPSGEFWQQIKSEHALGIFMPTHFANAQIDLVMVPV